MPNMLSRFRIFPEDFNMALMSSGVFVASCARMALAAPATNDAAVEVPPRLLYPPSFQVLDISTHGAEIMTFAP